MINLYPEPFLSKAVLPPLRTSVALGLNGYMLVETSFLKISHEPDKGNVRATGKFNVTTFSKIPVLSD